MPNAASFLDLPAELRVLVYEYIALADLISFADSFRLPSLLHVASPLGEEYADVFFADGNIAVDAYYPDTASWCAVKGKAAKKAIIELAAFSDCYDRSLASAQRSVQQAFHPAMSRGKHGILTVFIAGVPRWSRWKLAG